MTITTDTLDDGGKKNPAHMNESFLDDEDKRPRFALRVSKSAADKVFDGTKTLFTLDHEIQNSHEEAFLVMVENSIVGGVKLGHAFEMSAEEYEFTRKSHHDEEEYEKGTFGYRIIQSKQFETPIAVISKEVEQQLLNLEEFDVKSVTNTYICKLASNEERIVASAILVPGVTDLHKEIYDEEAVLNAAHFFMEGYRQDDEHGLDVMHDGKVVPNALRVLQSFVLDEEKTYEVEVPALDSDHPSTKMKKLTLPKGTWIMYVRVISDTLWEKVKDGGFTGFSIAGLARVTELRKILMAA